MDHLSKKEKEFKMTWRKIILKPNNSPQKNKKVKQLMVVDVQVKKRIMQEINLNN
jgi:hypothetical protein